MSIKKLESKLQSLIPAQYFLQPIPMVARSKGGYTLVTLPHIATPYRESVDRTRDRVTYQKLATLRGHESRCTFTPAPAVTLSSL